MSKITYTADNGSVEEFVDQATVDAAVAAARAVAPVAIAEETVTFSDGTEETLVPEPAVPSDAPTEAPADTEVAA